MAARERAGREPRVALRGGSGFVRLMAYKGTQRICAVSPCRRVPVTSGDDVPVVLEVLDL
jgi:hypothetical protein